MKGNKLFIMGMAMMLVMGILSPLAAAENDSIHVVMTVEDRNYSPGDTITVQLKVYDAGAPKDLPDITDAYLGMSTNHGLNNPVNITLTKPATGVYQGQYTVKASDNNHHLYFFYTVNSGNDYEEGQARITVYSIQDTVDVTIGGQKNVPARPGDELHATVLVRTGSTPIPITGFTQLYLETPTGQRQNLTYTEKSTGIYDVLFSMPETSVSGTYELLAQPLGIGNTDSARIHLNVMEVWYHKISSAGDQVSFEVCVADSDGKAISGANFYVRRNGWPNDEYFGVTNVSGKYLLHITNVDGTASFSGYVLAAGLNQTIEGAVFNPLAEQPHHSGFDIIWEGTDKIFKPNTEVTIPYGAYVARVPASTKTMHYYVTATGTDFSLFGGTGSHLEVDREVISAGTITTDALGKFSLAFKTPAKQCEISVRIEVPLDRSGFVNQTYDLDDGMFYDVWPPNQWDSDGFVFHAYQGKLDGDGGVSLSIGSFKPGKAGKVTVSLDAEPGDPVLAFWGIGPASLDKMDSYDPEWMSWVPAGNMIQLQENDKGKLQGEFLLPEFIKGQDVTVATGYAEPNGIPHFDVKTASPGSNIPWLWIGIIVIIIVVVIVIIVVGKQQMWF